MSSPREWWIRLERERSSLLIVVFAGIQAFLIVAVATRLLSAADAAVFLVAWSTLNTFALAVFAPMEAMAPAMVGAPESSGTVPDAQTNRVFMRRFYFASGVLCVAMAPLLAAFLSGDSSAALMGAAALFLAAYTLTSYFRSRAFSSDRIPRAAALTALALVLWLLALAGVSAFLGLTVALLILTAAFALGVSPLLLSASAVRSALSRPWRRQSCIAPTGGIRSLTVKYLHVAGSGLTMMVPPAIGLLLAAQIGTPAAVIVSYGGAVVLARGMFLGLGALSTSFTVRYAVSKQSADVAGYRRLFRYHTAILAAVVLAACVGAFVAGGWIITAYTGQPFALSTIQLVLVVLGEGLFTMAAIPRMILIIENRPGGMNLVWAVAALLSIGVMILPIEPVTRLVLAPLLAGGFACLTLFPHTLRILRSCWQQAK